LQSELNKLYTLFGKLPNKMSITPKYLLCRPLGGLNDTLCRIALCWKYAAEFNRTLVIDCQKSSLFGNFSDYFLVENPSIQVITAMNDSLLGQLNALPCRPEPLTNHPPNTFPAKFDQDFSEPLVVFEDSGGGIASFDLLPRLRLAPLVQEKVEAALASLGNDYQAVHIRNTDYRTDYRKLFARIRHQVGRSPLLVCSDDPKVVDFAKKYFVGPVLTIPKQIATQDSTKALHTPNAQLTDDGRRRVAIESLVDLICLANARTLYCGTMHSVLDGVLFRDTGKMVFRKVPSHWVSGFSKLAQHLCQNKDVLDTMRGIPEPTRTSDPTAVKLVDLISIGMRLRKIRRRIESKVRRIIINLKNRVLLLNH
jgi:hypothetical protein